MSPSTSRLLIFSLPPVLINLVLFFLVLAQAQPDFRYSGCMNDYGNYTANSTYQNNLNLLLSSLPSNASSNNGFYGASAGQNSSRVSAIALCRGDVSSDGCRSCITNSAIKLLQLCPTQVEAMGGYDECMLRYSNRSILGGVSEVSPAFWLWNPNNFSVNATEFNDKLGEMMGRLQQRAAFGHTVRKYFATEIVNLTSFQKLYGLVQCTPDLENAACSSCIETAVSQIPDCCDGKQGGRVVMPSCNIRYESAPFYDSTSAAAPPPSPSNNSFSPPYVDNPATNSSTGDESNTTRTVIIAVVATVFLFLVVIIGCVLWRKKPQEKLESTHNVDGITSVESLHVDFDTIRIATDNFSEQNKLGQGGFGAVYKGKLVSGKEIAVKRLSMGSRQGDLEFKNEAMLVAKLQHRNLVRLLGFSLKGDERLLIYEYVPNMSLDHFIFDPAKRLLLDFDRRHKIIQGIARGLLYLHEDSRLRIIHRDLKAGNILLDEEMNPKIADFGTARLFPMDQTQGNTSRPMGTYGYMAPEYVLQGRFSVKSDVFSFGVLVLEIVSGQKSNCFRIGGTLVDLLAHAWRSWREGTALNLVDPSLRDGSCTEMMRCVHVGLLCVQENIADRPTMAAVVMMLSTDSVTLPVPSQPAFFMHSRTGSCTISSQESSGGTVSDHSYHKSEKTSLDDEAAASGSDLYPWLSQDF